jgi:hypothetical protein
MVVVVTTMRSVKTANIKTSRRQDALSGRSISVCGLFKEEKYSSLCRNSVSTEKRFGT